MLKIILFGFILFFIYRVFVKPLLVSPQANAPLDQLQDLISKLQQQQGKNTNSNNKTNRNNPTNDDEYTDYEEIK